MIRLSAIGLLLCMLGAAASAAEFALTESVDVVGAPQVVTARYEDTFVALARRHNVGFESLRRANPGVDAWLPGEGTEVVIPSQFVLPRAPRQGIVVNVAELRLYYYPDGASGRVFTYPISVGRMDWSTPLGVTTITAKTPRPTWYPTASIRAEHEAAGDPLPAAVPPGPDNPLGEYALRLGLPAYLIHGTNKPSGVGMRVTHGCIRMFPEDIEALFAMVPVGTQVRIVNQPYKLGWGEDGLYLEAHLPFEEDTAAAEERSATALTHLFVAATETRMTRVSWDAAERVMQAARGIPEFVSEPDQLASN